MTGRRPLEAAAVRARADAKALISLRSSEKLQAAEKTSLKAIAAVRATGGGMTAGIDFGLAMVGHIAGDPVGRVAELSFEYGPA